MVEALKYETGMDIICSVCLEYKSLASSSRLDFVPREIFHKFAVEEDFSKNIDGFFYICSLCKSSIKKGQEPIRAQRELFGLLDFPNKFKEKLFDTCQPVKHKENFIELNKVEDFLLKLVIPFIRIGHLPRGPYFKVRGNLIMISSDIVQSLNSILPISQELIPVSFKRRIEYSGHFAEEYIDKQKVLLYFDFFKKYNHLYKNFTLEEDVLEQFESDNIKIANADFDVNSSDSDDDDDPPGASISATIITDKYGEDSKAPTVANKLADMIVQFEKDLDTVDSPEVLVFEPGDEIYFEDEQMDEEHNEIQEDDEEIGDIQINLLSDDDFEKLNHFEEMKNDFKKFSNINLEELCKCSLSKIGGMIFELSDHLQKLVVDNEDLQQKIKSYSNKVIPLVNQVRILIKEKSDCNHTFDNEISKYLKSMVFDKSKKPEEIVHFIDSQRKKIDKKLQKLSVAPGEKGKWINWGSDLYLEEKLFPALFPFGWGGYLSSNMLKNSNIGFSNYVKSRLLSVNPKFRKDPFYCFFLLLVKEMVDIQRSEATVFRKATKVPNLNRDLLKETSLDFLMRNNNAFTTFKTIRGYAPYYQDIKKKLMAFIRQNGAPTLFCTFSSAEFDWCELAKTIYETNTKQKVTMEFIKSQSTAWRTKLISDNVAQSTIHFSKRTDKLMSILKKPNIFKHDGVTYTVSSYFYRVEFQARGAPHLHCMFWLKDEHGESPPVISADDVNSENWQKLASFSSSLICSSSTDVNCHDHSVYTENCENCFQFKEEVERYQTHSHKHSCLKKNKIIRIKENEGHGKYDGKKEDDELMVKVCRYNFPKNPIDKTEYVMGFSKDHDVKEVKKAKEDYARIRKYLLRLTHEENFRNGDSWDNFCSLTFYEYLYAVGMYEDGVNLEDEKAKANARKRYLNALRCEVKSSGFLLLKRETKDVFTNNFNKNIFNIHVANQDIQIITDEYAVAQYITDYCTKLESGQSAMLKNINEEAVSTGESFKETIKKLKKELDKGREVSIQEAIYRIAGLPMTKFSEIVKFINSNHPQHREGLLKSNIDELEEGESIFHNSVHDYYQSRPRNSLNDSVDWEAMTLAEFVANYTIYASKPASKYSIKLLNKKGYIIKRQKECIIRYFIKYEDQIETYRALCILFLPFRNEMIDIHSKDIELLYKENENIIDQTRNHFEKHRALSDLIREVEENKELNDEDNDDECNSDDDDPNNFEETTTEEEMNDYLKYVQTQSKRQIRKYNEGKEIMPDDQFLDLVRSLNSKQRAVFDDFVERMKDHEDDDNFFLYIGGEAGTGKSFLLRLMIEAVRRLPKYSGQTLGKPFSITIAPTGIAACNVGGSTIESALSIQPQKRKTYEVNSASRNSNLRFLYEDLKVVIIDEISMVGSDKLAKISYRLQVNY